MKDRFHPYQRSDKGTRDQKSSKPAWKNIGAYNQKERARPHIFQIVFSTTGPESGQTVNLNVISHAHFVLRHPQKKGISPVIVKQKDQKLKCVNNVSCVDQLCSVKQKMSHFCTKSDCRSQTKPVLGNLGNFEGQTQSNTNVERRVHPILPDQTKLDQKTHNCQLLCKSPQEPLPVGGIASADKQKVGHKPRISGLLQLAIFGSKTKQQMETHTRSEQSPCTPQPTNHPSINFLHLTVYEICPRQDFKDEGHYNKFIDHLHPLTSFPHTYQILHLTVSEISTSDTLQFLKYSPDNILKVKVTTARSNVNKRSHHEAAHLHPLTNVPTKYPTTTSTSYTVWFLL